MANGLFESYDPNVEKTLREAREAKDAQLAQLDAGSAMAMASRRAGGMFSDAIRGGLGVQRPEVQQNNLMKDAMQEVESAGHQDMMSYTKHAAQALAQRGLYKEALKAREEYSKYATAAQQAQLEQNKFGLEQSKAGETARHNKMSEAIAAEKNRVDREVARIKASGESHKWDRLTAKDTIDAWMAGSPYNNTVNNQIAALARAYSERETRVNGTPTAVATQQALEIASRFAEDNTWTPDSFDVNAAKQALAVPGAPVKQMPPLEAYKAQAKQMGLTEQDAIEAYNADLAKTGGGQAPQAAPASAAAAPQGMAEQAAAAPGKVSGFFAENVAPAAGQAHNSARQIASDLMTAAEPTVAAARQNMSTIIEAGAKAVEDISNTIDYIKSLGGQFSSSQEFREVQRATMLTQRAKSARVKIQAKKMYERARSKLVKKLKERAAELSSEIIGDTYTPKDYRGASKKTMEAQRANAEKQVEALKALIEKADAIIIGDMHTPRDYKGAMKNTMENQRDNTQQVLDRFQ